MRRMVDTVILVVFVILALATLAAAGWFLYAV